MVGIKVASELVDSSRKRKNHASKMRVTSKKTVSIRKEKKKHN